MKDDNKIVQQLNLVMQDTLQQLQHLVNQDESNQVDLVTVVKVFLFGVITSAVELVETAHPDSAPILYADLEAVMKMGGIGETTKVSTNNGTAHYSLSNIDEDDVASGMNYIGQQLVTTLFKGLHELPMKQRSQEMMIRCIEVLLTNLLHQKFGNQAHQLLDALCGHVHMALIELESRSLH